MKKIIIPMILATNVFAVDINFKGFVKAEIVNSSAGVGSYGNKYSHVATTRALKTDQDGTGQAEEYYKSAATSFQAAQSRFSLVATEDKMKSVIEFDMIDGDDGFTNQTALQAQGPRLRLATIYYNLTDDATVFIGQKWSSASGNKAIGSYNFVGNGFQAGNTGFLAQEMGVEIKSNNFTYTLALTGKGRNLDNNGVNYNELGSTPGAIVDINYNTESFRLGLVHATAELNFKSSKDYVSGENVDASLSKIYGNYNVGKLKVLGEYYVGNAISNMNALGVSPATGMSSGVVQNDFSESGFWLTAKYQINDLNSVNIGHGSAAVDSGDHEYLTSAQMQKNSYLFANYSRKLKEKLTAYVQVTQHSTDYGEDSGDSFEATVTQFGMVAKF